MTIKTITPSVSADSINFVERNSPTTITYDTQTTSNDFTPANIITTQDSSCVLKDRLLISTNTTTISLIPSTDKESCTPESENERPQSSEQATPPDKESVKVKQHITAAEKKKKKKKRFKQQKLKNPNSKPTPLTDPPIINSDKTATHVRAPSPSPKAASTPKKHKISKPKQTKPKQTKPKNQHSPERELTPSGIKNKYDSEFIKALVKVIREYQPVILAGKNGSLLTIHSIYLDQPLFTPKLWEFRITQSTLEHLARELNAGNLPDLFATDTPLNGKLKHFRFILLRESPETIMLTLEAATPTADEEKLQIKFILFHGTLPENHLIHPMVHLGTIHIVSPETLLEQLDVLLSDTSTFKPALDMISQWNNFEHRQSVLQDRLPAIYNKLKQLNAKDAPEHIICHMHRTLEQDTNHLTDIEVSSDILRKIDSQYLCQHCQCLKIKYFQGSDCGHACCLSCLKDQRITMTGLIKCPVCSETASDTIFYIDTGIHKQLTHHIKRLQDEAYVESDSDKLLSATNPVVPNTPLLREEHNGDPLNSGPQAVDNISRNNLTPPADAEVTETFERKEAVKPASVYQPGLAASFAAIGSRLKQKLSSAEKEAEYTMDYQAKLPLPMMCDMQHHDKEDYSDRDTVEHSGKLLSQHETVFLKSIETMKQKFKKRVSMGAKKFNHFITKYLIALINYHNGIIDHYATSCPEITLPDSNPDRAVSSPYNEPVSVLVHHIDTLLEHSDPIVELFDCQPSGFSFDHNLSMLLAIINIENLATEFQRCFQTRFSSMEKKKPQKKTYKYNMRYSLLSCYLLLHYLTSDTKLQDYSMKSDHQGGCSRTKKLMHMLFSLDHHIMPSCPDTIIMQNGLVQYLAFLSRLKLIHDQSYLTHFISAWHETLEQASLVASAPYPKGKGGFGLAYSIYMILPTLRNRTSGLRAFAKYTKTDSSVLTTQVEHILKRLKDPASIMLPQLLSRYTAVIEKGGRHYSWVDMYTESFNPVDLLSTKKTETTSVFSECLELARNRKAIFQEFSHKLLSFTGSEQQALWKTLSAGIHSGDCTASDDTLSQLLSTITSSNQSADEELKKLAYSILCLAEQPLSRLSLTTPHIVSAAREINWSMTRQTEKWVCYPDVNIKITTSQLKTVHRELVTLARILNYTIVCCEHMSLPAVRDVLESAPAPAAKVTEWVSEAVEMYRDCVQAWSQWIDAGDVIELKHDLPLIKFLNFLSQELESMQKLMNSLQTSEESIQHLLRNTRTGKLSGT